MKYFLLLLSLFFLVSCASHKKKTVTKTDTETSSQVDSSSVQKKDINAGWIRDDNSIISRDGLTKIDFDGMTEVTITPDNEIKAKGNNPKINHQSRQEETRKVNDSLFFQDQTKTKTDLSKKEDQSIKEVLTDKEKKTTPSLVPWIGAGLAIAIIILVVLFFFFRRR